VICTICDQPIEDGQPRKRVARTRDRYTHKACRTASTTVPFITAWSGEQHVEPLVVYRLLGGIGYSGEQPQDRDSRGVLWLRRHAARGSGRPLYGDVHPGRQRLAMERLLCQVCGEPTDTDERGVLWLLEDARTDWEGWPNELLTTHPPICRPCVSTARQECPHMWRGSVLVRVGRSEVCAVWGRRYTPSRLGPVPIASAVVLFDSPLLGWTVASQLVRALYECKIVSVDEELSTARP
jgi:hypothetical protein